MGALHQVARERLQRWLGWVASRDTQLSAEKEGEQPQVRDQVPRDSDPRETEFHPFCRSLPTSSGLKNNPKTFLNN